MAKETQETQKIKRNPGKEFAVIRLPKKAKGSKEPEIVTVRVNGERIQIKRNEFVPVRKMHILALRNAVEPVVESEEEQPGDVHMVRRRKIVSTTPRFPFELVGWVDEKDFIKFKKIATRRSITQEEVDNVIYD